MWAEKALVKIHEVAVESLQSLLSP